jgi:hypothetical protein
MPQGKSPQEVMTPAVADPSKLGYLKLYKMMLDMVSCGNTCEQFQLSDVDGARVVHIV